MLPYPELSLWLGQCGPLEARPRLASERDYDVAIVGGGYTGLWTAYYLKRAAPELTVCLLESEICGFGASGRNGGWLMAALENENHLLAATPVDQRDQLRQTIQSIIPEVAAVVAREAIDCDFHHGGGIYAAARYDSQLGWMREELEARRTVGYPESDYRWMEPDELTSRLGIRKPLGGVYTSQVARVQPAKLARGLAEVVAGLGVDIFEQSPVLRIEGDALVCAGGRVNAPRKLMAMEGFSNGLAGQRRRVLPVSSRIIATEALSDELWESIGLAGREVFSEASPLISYGQRTADGRMVFGSRGDYRFGGKSRSDFSADAAHFARVHALLLDCFPQLEGVAISHRWGGTLGIPRNGLAHAVFDPASGLGSAGGYSGEGVGASNLMARTLVDLVLETDSELAAMPWAHRGDPQTLLRRWEPEPFPWLGYVATNALLQLEEWAHSRESAAIAGIASRASSAMEKLRR